ncbi:MAG: bifunctional homocysteine S-methyltransferase/methylenetetrahydrofolate reductase [Lentisphaeria bacterium]|nr:bifunctional homocysteine S-methyltransferase/methylenetetrahydrofolate reductase [Lentisphaeria bacterium]MBR7106914.1 bifunctional homocysteine S-methyltransferase/methylenetetrahydrofolate reductase [Lentisphaeria bacterium]
MKIGDLRQRLLKDILIFDGGFGSELYRKNFFVNTSYDDLCLSAPAPVTAIHQAYAEAGAEVLTTNTYNANALALQQFGIADRTKKINQAAVAIARKAAAGKPEILIAGSIGPAKAKTAAAIAEQAEILRDSGADFLIFESISSMEELASAVNAFPGEIPCVTSFVLNDDALLSDGGTFEDILAQLANAPYAPDAIGINCGNGPETTLNALEKIIRKSDYPVITQPGSGIPRSVDNRFMQMTTPEYFTTYSMRYLNLGARGLGGCCGITPEHIADMVRSLKPLAAGAAKEMPAVEVKDVEELEPVELAKKSSFGEKLAAGKFVKLIELTPPKGFDLTATVEKAKICAAAGVDAINIPDGPRASCRISQIITAIEIQEKAGIETIIHCCARDRNLISLQSMILGCMAKKLNNILYITGDPPKLGDYPFSSGVFDVDSIGMVKLQNRLNRGIDAGGMPLGNGVQTAIVAGVGADPNAIDMQREYRRLEEKIAAGAEFIITQPVFDPPTLLKFLREVRKNFGVPVIAGVWPFASYRNALFMKNEVPGVIVPEWIMEAMEKAGDKEAQKAEGIRIARTILEEIRPEINGVATSAPFGNVHTALSIF